MRTADPADCEILRNDLWVRRVGSHYFPDPEYDPAVEPNWEKWLGRAAKYLRDADDYWFHVIQAAAGRCDC